MSFLEAPAMENEVARKGPRIKGRIPVYVEVDRDLFFKFKDLLKAHKLDLRDGISWGMRALLTRAGVEVRADRGERAQSAEHV